MTRRLALLITVGALFGSVASSPAVAEVSVTAVARECPTYESVTANIARNNIMESLQQLGPDSPYESGDLVDPRVEEGEHEVCKPIVNWQFTLGKRIETRAVSGPWGSLAKVLDPFPTKIVTKEKTPELNVRGEQTGDEIKGAVTIPLTKEEADQAGTSTPGQLWIQGGTPGDPILNQVPAFKGPKYGFAALRCAVDALNGDNVEYIAFPDGVKHVWCFAYYVLPPPEGAGQIIVRKEVEGAPSGMSETFQFGGNVSFAQDGRFNLTAAEGKPGQTQAFYRGATGETAAGANFPQWTVNEKGRPDWELIRVECDSPGGSTFTTSLENRNAVITLAAGDVVTCTFVNRFSPPPRGLELLKETHGGVGEFSWDVKPASGGQSKSAHVTTTESGVPTLADPAPMDLPEGTYEVTENLPQSDAGHWKLTAIRCNGDPKSLDQPLTITVPAEGVKRCYFTNTFIPRGSITISKRSLGGGGRFNYTIYSQQGERPEYRLTATTKEPGVPVDAKGEDTSHLELGDYHIIEFPPPSVGEGEWALLYVECGGKPVPFAQGRIEIALTAEHPHRHCLFVNEFDRKPPPEPSPQPEDPVADLDLTKEALVHGAPRVGDTIPYRVTVVNRGRDAAGNVKLIDRLGGKVSFVSASAGVGPCSHRFGAVICRVGRVKPGGRRTATITVRVRRPGAYVNRAVAGTQTKTVRLRRAQDDARIRVRPAPKKAPPFTG